MNALLVHLVPDGIQIRTVHTSGLSSRGCPTSCGITLRWSL